MNKIANIGNVKKFMAMGMGAKEAIKKAYPGWPEERVNALASKLGGSEKMEKEASALDGLGAFKDEFCKILSTQ